MSCWTPLSFPSYSGDTFPDHWSEAETEKMKLEYRAKSGRKPVTPKNLSSWVRSAGKRELRWQFWELASGSSRLSLTCFWQRWWLDFRYGWDLGHPPHQAMPRSCQAEFCPAHLFAAPSCRPWSVASASKPTAAREADRARELPTLEFLYEILLFQRNSNLGFTLEQPYGSQLCSQTVQSRLRDNGGIRTWRLDQCVLGAQDETGAPVRKATALLTYRRLKMVIKRCAIIEVEPMGCYRAKFAASTAQRWQRRTPSGCVSCLAKTCGTFSAGIQLSHASPGPNNCSGCTACTTFASIVNLTGQLLPDVSTPWRQVNAATDNRACVVHEKQQHLIYHNLRLLLRLWQPRLLMWSPRHPCHLRRDPQRPLAACHWAMQISVPQRRLLHGQAGV